MTTMFKAVSGVAVLVMTINAPRPGFSQSSTTGALTGIVTDTSQATVPGVTIQLANEASGEVRSTTSNADGSYSFQLVAPGRYLLQAELSGFKTVARSGIRVSVTETTRLDLTLELGTLQETVTVAATSALVQLDNSSLGRVVGAEALSQLPLVNRNYTQILALSPGITSDLTNAGELGRGSGGQTTARTSVNGARANDNNFQIDGVDVTDVWASDIGNTPGAPVPNPDTIQEFKVQTGQADAAFGRNAGASINVITKSGGNTFRGSAFEFFRNEALNANDFFFERNSQPKPIVRQNQFGGTLGGPAIRDKLLFFASYQKTEQTNGLAAKSSASCSTVVTSPPLTDDRSAGALGALFAGQRGVNGGVAILADGSNVNPVALAVLNQRLPDGSYVLPTPQRIDPSLPFAIRGSSSFSRPCTFDENQYMANVDFLHNNRSHFVFRVFQATSDQFSTFNKAGSGTTAAAASTLGGGTSQESQFVATSLSHSLVLSPRLYNEVRVAYNRTGFLSQGSSPFKFSDIGIATVPEINDLPNIRVTGSYNAITGTAFVDIPQESYAVSDQLSYVVGKHNLRLGGGATYRRNAIATDRFIDDPSTIRNSSGTITFLSFPDFLLGMDAAANGSLFSNVFSSSYSPTSPRGAKTFDVLDGFGYVQDDFKVSQRLTLNLGLRYDRLGHSSDPNGLHGNFDIRSADPNPPPAGTLQGYLVANNWPGTIPAGIARRDDDLAVNGTGQNNWGPRIGLAWQVLPRSNRLVMRGGYGVYYTHTTGNSQAGLGAQFFGLSLSGTGTTNATATFQDPFRPLPPNYDRTDVNALMAAQAYSPTTTRTVSSLSMDYRPGITQQYSVNTQAEFGNDFLWEVGYVGTHGTHMNRGITANQASLASPSNPIRGVTTNTVANVPSRVGIQGFQATGISLLESEGETWYNAFQTSLTKRLSKGVQALVSYTWSRALDTDGAKAYNSDRAGGTPGDQLNEQQRYGPSELMRAHRVVVSAVYDIPNVSDDERWLGWLVRNWSVSGVGTFQSGNRLSILYTNATNVYGITTDRASFAPGCTAADLVNDGDTRDKLDAYFNASCLASPAIMGDDGRATTFGDTPVGLTTGPAQANIDMVVIKTIPLGSTRRIELRGEVFNLFNTVNFSNPDTDFSSTRFGQITSTSTNPRFIQLAVRILF